jgi:hypothetical protein
VSRPLLPGSLAELRSIMSSMADGLRPMVMEITDDVIDAQAAKGRCGTNEAAALKRLFAAAREMVAACDSARAGTARPS